MQLDKNTGLYYTSNLLVLFSGLVAVPETAARTATSPNASSTQAYWFGLCCVSATCFIASICLSKYFERQITPQPPAKSSTKSSTKSPTKSPITRKTRHKTAKSKTAKSKTPRLR